MTPPSRKTLAANAVALLVSLWLYGGDLLDAIRARSAEVSAFSQLPALSWPVAVLAAILGTAAVAGWGLLRRRPDDFKGYRLLPILLVLALFVDLVFAEQRTPLGSDDVALIALRQFQDQANALATQRRDLPTEPQLLQPLLKELGEPPYLIRGERPKAYTLQVRQGCEGPVAEAAGALPGTLLYCVSGDKAAAWVTLVGLPVGERFGPPAVVSLQGQPQVVVISPSASENEEALAEELPIEEALRLASQDGGEPLPEDPAVPPGLEAPPEPTPDAGP